MKKLEFRKDGMKCIFNSGCKVFDDYIISVSTGNVSGGGQTSSYIRAFNNTECNGFTRIPGYLQKWDLDGFTNLPEKVRSYVQSVAHSESVILYEFYHRNPNYKEGYYRRGRFHSKFITHGYVVTDYRNKLLRTFVTGPTYKSELVIQAVLPYITEEECLKEQILQIE